jgi:hypothetical protein
MPYSQQSPSYNSGNYQPDGTSQTAGIAPNQQFAPGGDPSSFRLGTLAEGIVKGGTLALEAIAGSVFNFGYTNANPNRIAPEDDWRVRISMQPDTAALFYRNPNNPILYPLSNTNGVVFPYTPSVDINHKANYAPQGLTHSNYNNYFYERSEVQSININGDFTVQNIEEGQYLAAAIQFFKSCTKMFYGGSQLAGTPPPMVFLDGFGPSVLPHVPCVVTDFGYTLPADIDYVKVPVGVKLEDVAGNPINASNYAIPTRLPTFTTLRITLQPIYSRNNVARNFTLEQYAAGGLIQDAKGSNGGFI